MRGLYGLDLETRTGDVLDPASIERVVPGCAWVFHAAARYALGPDPTTVTVAVEGTRHVLTACARAGVERVIFTSSAIASGTSSDPARSRTEQDWSDDASNSYVHAKLESERLAHALARELALTLVVVQPSTLLGPHDWRPTPSTGLVRRFLTHGMPACPQGGLNIVDVEDAAAGHLLAAERGKPGERYLLTGANLTYRECFALLAELTGRRPPLWTLPAGALTALGWLMERQARAGSEPPLLDRRSARALHRRYGFYDGSKARTDLGFNPRPARAALLRAARWLVDAGLVPKRAAAKLRLAAE